MEIIIPAAGLSTRFPNMRPKYSLTDHTLHMMIERSIGNLVNDHHITIGLLKENEEKYSIVEHLNKVYGDKVSVVILPNRTGGPADTVYQILKTANINTDTEILIKDCDSFFDHEYQDGNYVCVSSIKDHEVIKRVGAKSFIISNNQGIITSIVEKQIVSDKFCVGGYKFESAGLFVTTYEKLVNAHVDEIFVSHVIEECINNKYVFTENKITNYVDVGTAEDWFEYNDKSLLFCDIDGTIVKAQSKIEMLTSDPIPLEDNIKRLKELAQAGSTIIFTTARPKEHDALTIAMLTKLGFTNIQLISGLPNTKRVLINDYNDANPYPRAVAINIKRDHNNLKDFL